MNSELSILLLTVHGSFPIYYRVITLCVCDIFLIFHHQLPNDFKVLLSPDFYSLYVMSMPHNQSLHMTVPPDSHAKLQVDLRTCKIALISELH